jgi:hypothetical protein
MAIREISSMVCIEEQEIWDWLIALAVGDSVCRGKMNSRALNGISAH